MGDFEMDTNGRCFICLDQIPSIQLSRVKLEQESGSALNSGVHSLRYLSRYVKLDMSKVFSDGVDVPPDLLAKVAKATLKVELCEECRSVNESFSKLYRQLEKVELEMSSHISRIHRKLEKAKEAITHFTVECSSTEKLKITEALREETKEKCSQKLTIASGLNVKIQKWTMKQVNAERRKIQFNSISKRQNFSIQRENIVPEGQVGHESSETVYDAIKEESFSLHTLRDDDGNDYFDDNDVLTEDLEESPSLNRAMTTPPFNMDQEPQEKAPKYFAENDVTTEPNFEIEDGSYKCKVCSKRFTTKANWQTHYKSIHLKIKYKCNLCGMEFNVKGNYTRHHQRVHVGLKFKCLLCNKTFTQKFLLAMHQRTSCC